MDRVSPSERHCRPSCSTERPWLSALHRPAFGLNGQADPGVAQLADQLTVEPVLAGGQKEVRAAMLLQRRGRNMLLTYICREHRERGDAACTNTTGVPAAELHMSVIASLRDTFTPETFIAQLESQAANVEAKAQRAAERANLLAELPKLAAAEQRLVKRIATVEDDALAGALEQEWSAAGVGGRRPLRHPAHRGRLRQWCFYRARLRHGPPDPRHSGPRRSRGVPRRFGVT
jgi:hypothetical protein